MISYIDALVESAEDLVGQTTGHTLSLKNIRIKEELKIQEALIVVMGICGEDKSFQIMINYSEVLAKNISSIVKCGVPIAILDTESKNTIIRISKMIISNSIVKCESKIEDVFIIQPSLMQANNITYSSEGLMTILEFEILNEDMEIVIMPIRNIEDLEGIKKIEEKYV